MSNRYNQGKFSVVAGVSTDKNHRPDGQFKKGLVIGAELRTELLKKYSQIELHAGIINCLIEDQKDVNELIVCSDVNPVGEVINLISIARFKAINKMISIEGLRKEKYINKLKSAADPFAKNIKRNFPKKKNIHRIREFFKDGTVTIVEQNSKEHKQLLYYLKKLKK